MTQGETEIREAVTADLPDILRLYAQPSVNGGQVLTLDAAEAIFRRFTQYPRYRLYVATQRAAVVGTFALLIMDNLAHMGAPSAVVEDVCVDERMHRQGVGRAMMQLAMKVAAECGCYKLTLSSNMKRTDAHAFYDGLGFERHGYSFRVDLR